MRLPMPANRAYGHHDKRYDDHGDSRAEDGTRFGLGCQFENRVSWVFGIVAHPDGGTHRIPRYEFLGLFRSWLTPRVHFDLIRTEGAAVDLVFIANAGAIEGNGLSTLPLSLFCLHRTLHYNSHDSGPARRRSDFCE